MKTSKLYLLVILLVTLISISAAVFNHLNPWAGMAIAAVTVLGLINYIQNQFKQNEKK